MKDAYGMEYKKLDMNTDYSVKVNTFSEGVKKIKDEQVLCSYKDNKKNFIFQLALYILLNSRACQLYLQAKYFKIYVDEDQDCDKDMHKFFMYICSALKINADYTITRNRKDFLFSDITIFTPKEFLSI